METLASRLKTVLKEQKVSQTDLATEIGIKPQSIQAICSGKAKASAYLSDIAQILGVSPVWLRSGKGPRLLAGDGMHYLATGRVPMVDWSQVPSLDLIEIGSDEKTRWINTPKPMGADSFALTIESKSMMSADGDSFPPKHIISVDPKWPVENDCYVIVSIDGQPPVLRHYAEDEGKKYLRILNPSFPNPVTELSETSTIHGVVRGLYRDFD